MFENVSLIAVILAAIVNVAIGMAWYSPKLFGPLWLEWMVPKLKQEDCQPKIKHFLGAFILALITAWVLATVIYWSNSTTGLQGAQIGAWMWLGFVATTLFSGVIWASKPFKIFVLCAGCDLVTLILMGALLGAWQ